jgi:hypothetical protein
MLLGNPNPYVDQTTNNERGHEMRQSGSVLSLRTTGLMGGIGVLLLAGALLFGDMAASAQSSPAGGTIKVWVTPNNSGPGGTILITGAIADHGKTLNVNAAGKTDTNGNYVKLELKKGMMLVNSTQFNSILNNAQPTDYDATTCSASVTGTGPVQIVSGTKAYSGITGSLTLTATFAFIGPFTKKGQCNTSNNAAPVAQWSAITGSGTVSFG